MNAQLRPRLTYANVVSSLCLAPNAVSSRRVKDRSLRAADFAQGQLPQGAQGPPGVVGAITVERTDFVLADNSTTGVQVLCGAGQRVLGGGSSIDPTTSDDIHTVVSRPFRSTPGADGSEPVDGETFDAWRVTFRNPPGGTVAATAHARAICAGG